MSPPSVKFTPTGAALQELILPSGRNLVLNFHTGGEYADNPSHFGATIGRVANRLKGAKLDCVDGKAWTLDANNGPNCLHGGHSGWGKKDWRGPTPVSVNGKECVEFKYLSAHLDEGFPGEVEVRVLYSAEEDRNRKFVVTIDYEAKLLGGADETAVNITNHSYFNLSNGATIAGTQAELMTATHLALDDNGIPISTAATPHPDLTPNRPFTLGAETPGFDDCFVFPSAAANPSRVPLDTRNSRLRSCGKFYHPESKIHLEVASTEPAFQFYTGEYIDVEAREDGTPARRARAGFCVEPSRFVNAANKEEWKSQVLLRRGEIYGSKIVYIAWEDGI